ncbi:hypothetical protein [Caulobacter sp. RL271]|uniref:Restriction endonuclease type IV Mrr domain-containing protein n=1 Tax=Caulobacter segnis TaxID=88688 RepID=A0ABY4ZVX9_9CAUL|nr:hypothetical protein [Caulobacter segnis]USQ96519.1 hypothetical protein MZV50_02690 [Caulobacter segnis]
MSEASPFIDADARRLALEAIATLVNIKRMAAERLLVPAGVPADLIKRFLNERDPATNGKRSKREAGAVVLDALGELELEGQVVRRIIEIAADWQDFHLAQDEYRARSVVQKAREMVGSLQEMAAREHQEVQRRRREAELAREAAVLGQKRERNEMIRRESALLLAMFDQAVLTGDPQQRGYFLENLLVRLFDVHGVPAHKAFRRNGGGEQIDGAFEFEGWHYIAECRWREQLSDIRQLDGLAGQLHRSGKQTMGLFLSVNGWSNHVVDLLKQNPAKNILLMDAIDLRAVLSNHVGLTSLLKAKLTALNLYAEPYRPASSVLG